MAHGEMIDGVWHTRFHDTKSTGGRFKRTEPKFRNWVTPDGSAGPSGSGGFAAARGRYHLYVSLACPWAHRTVVFRKLKGLEDVISMDVVEPVMGDEGWQFGPDADRDTVNGKTAAARDLSARRPALHRPRLGAGAVGQGAAHHRQQRVAGNHPHAQFGVRCLHQRAHRLLPGRTARRDRRGQRRGVFQNVNNGVYRCGFASTQEAYEEAFLDLFGTLDQLEERLSRQRYLAGASDHRGRLAAVHHADPRSTRSITRTSSATCAASWIIRTCRTICASSTRCRASPRR